MVPRLLGRVPWAKQSPIASLECYVPADNRYHAANEADFAGGPGALGEWASAGCQLACPCRPLDFTKPTTDRYLGGYRTQLMAALGATLSPVPTGASLGGHRYVSGSTEQGILFAGFGVHFT